MVREVLMGGVDHDRAVEAGIDAVVAGLLVAVVEVDGEDVLRIHLRGGADEGLKHALVGVFPRALGKLDDEGGLGVGTAFEEAEDLLHVVHVVGADGELAVGDLEELRGGDDHRWALNKTPKGAFWQVSQAGALFKGPAAF
ncbi:MAG: hypothetical protein PW734_04220 [Verrucomicrobium sp.]|nr:hypothetical protein [Verrucomicrobium sp.]